MLGSSQARSGVLNTRDYGKRGDARWASTIEILQRLRKAGVKLAIDDLGTGYSSLSQLKRMPVDELKIDRSFVLGLAKGGEGAVIMKSTIALGHNIGLRVVAEGAEDERSWELLRANRRDMVQVFSLASQCLRMNLSHGSSDLTLRRPHEMKAPAEP